MRFAARGGAEEELELEEVSFPAQPDESRYTDLILDTALTPDRLEKRLLRLATDARTAEEEQGVNILYLSLGRRACGFCRLTPCLRGWIIPWSSITVSTRSIRFSIWKSRAGGPSDEDSRFLSGVSVSQFTAGFPTRTVSS